jgi:hypothetical protein
VARVLESREDLRSFLASLPTYYPERYAEVTDYLLRIRRPQPQHSR